MDVKTKIPSPEVSALAGTPSSDLLYAFPLSYAQQRLWFLDRLEPNTATYNIPWTLRISGGLDPNALGRALGALVERHEILRTTFASQEDQPVQIVHAPFRPHLQIVDLTGWPEQQRAAEATRLLAEEANRPFSLSLGPLIRAMLLPLEPAEYILRLSVHHIVTDGWSQGVLAGELSALYGAYAAGESPALAPLRIQYADYTLWQRDWLAAGVLESQLSYWREKLRDLAPVLNLPSDRPRPAFENFRGATYRTLFSKELLDRLQALSRREGATLFMTLLAGFQVLLGRYSGRQDIVVGSPIANRNRAEVEPLIGFFANTLALRTDLSGDPTFRAFLGRVKETALDAYARQDIPFEKLVEELQPERSLSHNPVVQVFFALQNTLTQPFSLPGLRAEVMPTDTNVSRADLTCAVRESPEGLWCAIEYNTDLFDGATIERMARHWQTLLTGIADGPDLAIPLLPMLDPAEHRLLVETFNLTATDFAEDYLHHFFERQAARTPTAVALVSGDARLTYSQLNRRANQLAHYLAGCGVGPDVLVAICARRSPDLLVGILAILKAGGAYVPLDPAYPKERIANILHDAHAPLLLTQSELQAGLPADGMQVVCLDSAWPEIALRPDSNPSPSAQPQHLAYVLFTSGSTGRPKGVALEHRSAATFIHWAQTVFTREELAGVLLSTSVCFDLSVFEMFVPLSVGGKVILAENALFLPTLPARDEVTLINTVPSAIAELVRMNGIPASVKTINLAGEALAETLVNQIYAATQVEKVYNLYGPTEDTTYSTYTLVKPDMPVTIGRPIANTQAYILDAHRNPVPIGIPGELHLAGAGLARGYYGRADLTAERFLANPFSVKPEARMYRTGDLCRWLSDGTIQYLGRMDDQVKLRGFRIELGEIEAQIGEYPGVRQAVVLVREDIPGDKRLVAYVVAEAGTAIQPGALRDALKEKLPDYMLPSAFVLLPDLPLSPNGKVDRKALPAPEAAAYAAREYEPPLGPVETTLAGIWADVLRMERVGRHDNFFALGGHSLLAVTLIERMRRSGLDVDIRALFLTPTLAELAAKAGGATVLIAIPANRIPPGCEAITPEMLPLVTLSAEEIERIVATVPGGAANVQDIYPLAPLQEGILFHHRMAVEGDAYLLACEFSFDRRTQLDSYLEALQAVIDRHDVLRSALVWEGVREPVQVVWRKARLQIEEVELDPAGGDGAGQLYARFDPRHYRIDVRQAPWLQAYLAHDASQERWLLLLLLHHLAGDHTTLEVMQEEICSYQLGQADRLPAAEPFRNLVAQARLGVSREEHETFFRELLGDVEEPTAPFGLLDVRGDGSGIEEAHVVLERALSRRVREGARRLRVSAASLCHLAWAQVLARVSGRDDVVFGTVLFGRMQGGAGVERGMGLYINTLPLRIPVGEEGVEASVRRTHTLLSELMRHEHASLALAQRASAVAAPAPLFSALLNYRHSLGAAQASPARLPEGMKWLRAEERTNYPLTLSIDDLGEDFRLGAQAPASVGPKRICEFMHTALTALVTALETNAAQPLRSLDVLPHTEREILEGWSAGAAPVYPQTAIHRLFEAQAEKTPAAIAVVFGDTQVSYAELNRRANRIAHALHRLGVKPGSRVGISLERSPEMIAGLLGILKAGGAYLPLDRSYPQQRLAFMIEDADIDVLLTTAAIEPLLPQHAAQVVRLEELAQAKQGSEDENLPGSLTLDDLAYVTYTSGSTGIPKGVEIPHRGVVRLLFGGGFAQLDPTQSLLQFAPVAFDASTLEIWGPLLHGGKCVLFDGDAPTAHQLGAVLRSQGVTTAWLTASLFNSIVDEAPQELASLRQLLVGGEALSVPHIRRALAQLPATQLINGYGPTESTTFTCTYAIPRTLEGNLASIPIGRPIGNTQVYLLERNLSPVPIGVAGELYIGGDGLARGYLQRPELTGERFVPHPFSGQPGARLYRTGDLCRWLSDGNIEYLGRLDNQVKIRGFRIELGEVEAQLARYPGVRQVVALVREDQPGDRRLVAYVVADEGASLATEELGAFLKQHLPDYMVPAAFVTVPEMPLTAHGKVDRKALPAPEYTGGQEYVAPRTPTEEILAAIWAEVLGVDRVGVHDNFFNLGGHSLFVTRAISRIRDDFRIELPLRTLFDAPTITELAQIVRAAGREQQGLEQPSVQPVSRNQPLPLSFAQQRLWFLDQLEPDSPLYNVPYIVRLTGRLNVEALEQSLQEIVRRHEALRTTFPMEEDGNPVQAIAPRPTLPLIVTDLTGLPEVEREGEARKLATQEARTPFDLAQGPLLRARLLRLGEQHHVFILNAHHIVNDGWSMGLLSQELGILYTAYLAGRPSPLPELTIQYADFAAWQRLFLSGESLEGQMAYWKQHLAGAPASLDLPIDRPRPPVQTFSGSAHMFLLPNVLLESLKDLARAERVTLFMTLLGAFSVLLSRYSGQEDIVIGSPIAGRNRSEFEHLIGFFVNTLALRIDLSGAPGFRQLLAGVRETTMGAYAHQDLPFEKLVEELNPVRDMSRSPIFQAAIVLQNAPGSGETMGDLSVSGFVASTETSKFDLLLALGESPRGLHAVFEYSTDLFDRATVERMARHWQTLLEGVAADPTQSIAKLPLLSDDERHQILVGWNNTTSTYPRAPIHKLFEAQAERTPEAVSLVFGKSQMTYRELNCRANEVAHELRKLGVGPDQRIGISVERSFEMIVGLLGILKAGGAYVPLDRTYPQQRLAFMMEDAGVRVLLTTASVEHELPAHKAQIVRLDQVARSGDRSQNLPNQAGLDHLAYVTFTSGSTGVPKGVEIPHRGVVRLLFGGGFAQLDENEALLQFAPVAFDASTLEIWGALLHGGKCVLFDGDAPSARELGEVLRKQGVSTAWLTSSLFNSIIDEAPEELASLRQILVGGEALSVSHIRRALVHLPATQLINGYGPTESTTFTCTYPIPRNLSEHALSVPIGRPIGNTQVYLLDRNLSPVPVGAAGELYIGGDGLARGYLNRPELTAERFVENPFSAVPGAHLYRTGDLCRWLVDGNVEYLGRLDDQVKIRGFRIELGEVEAQIGQYPGVRQVVAMVREDRPGDKRLVAYIVAEENTAIHTEDVRGFLKQKLPEYMVPGPIVLLDGLPLTAHGKADRKALPPPEYVADSQGGYIAPRTPVEEMVAGIWAEVLRMDRVGMEANFFELGGHSLLATQAVVRVRKALQIDLPLRALFEFPTAAALARQIELIRRAKRSSMAPAIVPVPRNQALPLSFAQQRLWFVNQLEPGNNFYNMPLAVRLIGALDVQALCQSLNEIVARHEVLRSTFAEENDLPVQVIASQLVLEVPLIDVTHVPETMRDAEARNLAQQEVLRPMDLQRGPLVRALLLRLAAQEHVLVLTLHHVIHDGWSWGVLLSELSALYRVFSSGEPSPLAPLPVQYADYAMWQRKWLQGEALETQLAYWRKQLHGMPPVLDLPSDRPRPAVQTFRGAVESDTLPNPLVQELTAFSHREGVTLFMTLLAAFQTLLSRYNGQDQIVVGTDFASRNSVETERLLGFFINVLPLRVDLSGDPTFRELLGRVREVALGAYDHQEMPFDKLVEELSPERKLSHNPLVQVLFVMQNIPGGNIGMPALTIKPFALEMTKSRFDLGLFVTPLAEGLSAGWTYSTELFDAATIRRFAGNYSTLLRSVVAQPDARIRALEFLTEEERAQQAMDKQERQQSKAAKLKFAKRKVVGIGADTEIVAPTVSGE